MMKLSNLAKLIHKVEHNSKNPTVIYSSIWKLKFIYKKNLNEISKVFCKEIIKLAKKKNVFIPVFTEPKNLKRINLLKEKVITGHLSEYLLKKKIGYRTINPFFSFLILGPKKETLTFDNVESEWGNGSLYEWLYNNDANIITIGTHPTHCSFSHYAEQLMKNVIKYRYFKNIKAFFVYKKKKIKFSRYFFFRKKNVKETSFHFMLNIFKKNKMKIRKLNNNFFITGMSAKKKIQLIVKEIKKKPNCIIQDN